MAYPDDGDPKSIQVLNALVALLEGINGTGYYHTVEHVVLYDGAELTVNAMPSIGVFPLGDTNLGDETCGTRNRESSVGLMLFLDRVAGTADWKTAMHWFVADVEVAINSDVQLGGLAINMTLGDIDIEDAQPNEGYVVGYLTLTIRFQYTIENPST